MANPLTGDFDVVAQFAVPAANRVLAAMHGADRFPHSMSIRVKDTRRPRPDILDTSIVETIDRFGDPVSNQDNIGNPRPFPGLRASIDPAYFALDPIVNIGNAGILDEPIVPTNFQGRAQLQVFSPTIEVADSSGTNINVHLQMLSRYFPDPNTNPAAEFIRGDLKLTVPVHQAVRQSPIARVVDIDVKASSVGISFTSQWSSRPLNAGDLTGIQQLIRNALRTSFLPSQSQLPSGISHMQFRTVQGGTNALSVLMNMSDAIGDRNSATNVFLGGGDDFALAAGSEFVESAFQSTIDEIRSRPLPKYSTYTFTITGGSVELQNGRIVLKIRGTARSPSRWRPNFSFTITQNLSLQVIAGAVELVIGSMSINASSTLVDIILYFIKSEIRSIRDAAIDQSGVRAAVRDMFSTETNLGELLTSLTQPTRRKPGDPPPAPLFDYGYSSIDIRPAGIVLHGWLSLLAWPQPHAEFEQIPISNTGPLGGAGIGTGSGPDYSALKTWIPGGTILKYEWKSLSPKTPSLTEEHKFVYINPGPALTTGTVSARLIRGFQPLCVTVHGSRLTASGPVVRENVSTTVCGVNSFPLFEEIATGALQPMLALAQPDGEGRVDVVGHTEARAARGSGPPPNLLIQFAEPETAGRLGVLLDGLRDSGREDASAAVVAIMRNGELSKAPYVDGVTYAEDQDGEWERRLGIRVQRRPLTAVVSPQGKVLWTHEGELDAALLASALKEVLVRGHSAEPNLPPSALRLGQRAPNFLFEYAPGREVTLRKVAGRPVVIAFWRSTSRQSVDLVRELGQTASAEKESPLVLAINDGEPAELALKGAKENKLDAVIVTDPARSISSAYGVNTWPTTVTIDARGAIRGIRFGRHAAESDSSQVVQTQTQQSRNGQ